jgi:site-specific recombinase XerD
LSELKYGFITDLEFWFKTLRKCSHNTTIKYITNVRKIINLAIDNEWLHHDPFAKFKVSLKEVKRECLSAEELQVMVDKSFKIDRLDQVKDIFVFCCYTGLAYADVEKLGPGHISKGMDGKHWIFIDRTKTGTSSHVPLLSPALAIINKYKDHPEAINKERLFPVISNQKMNAYLKEIAYVCGIQKTLTFHIARHTFATTVTLTNGVPLETVSNMLGHKNIRTTQIYAKVVQKKVSQDMQALEDKIMLKVPAQKSE